MNTFSSPLLAENTVSGKLARLPVVGAVLRFFLEMDAVLLETKHLAKEHHVDLTSA